jgi:2-C-methyl-D-erythritol 4-phosphate cytidylyltransferase
MFENQTVGAVIAAAGSSQRMAGIDKIFANLGGMPVLSRVIDIFQKCEVIDRIVIVLSKPNIIAGGEIVSLGNWSKVVGVFAGGERRQDSVVQGISHLRDCGWIVIHDGARPMVTIDLIKNGLEAAMETGSAIAAIPVTDTIKLVGEDLIVQGTPPRRNLWSVQTPQVFRFDIIDNAYRQLKHDVSDDAGAVEYFGNKVKIYQGSYDNIKITTPDDLAVAEVLWRKYDG